MRKELLILQWIALLGITTLMTGCASTSRYNQNPMYSPARFDADYNTRLPQQMDTQGRKLVLVDPNAHVWGAYEADGHLIKSGLATAGGDICPPDEHNEATCKTGIGTFRITRMGDGGCTSKVYPKPNGGGLMPYCMYFHNGQALHGSPDNTVIEDNVSHGCVRMRIQDAEWMRKDFAEVGTTVVVLPYN